MRRLTVYITLNSAWPLATLLFSTKLIVAITVYAFLALGRISEHDATLPAGKRVLLFSHVPECHSMITSLLIHCDYGISPRPAKAPAQTLSDAILAYPLCR